MPTLEIEASYDPLPAQEAFHRSQARFKFYGGAMGGGKSRALCEEAYQAALDFPGIEILMARQQHTDIVGSTRKTMFREVLPLELVKRSRIVKSGGFDFIAFPNDSVINFVGMNNPTGFHSAEFGLAIFDEAHEIDEDSVQTINSRLRQKCAACLEDKEADCHHMPHRMLFGANPENPGHWLWRYFFKDAEKTAWGQYKTELRLEEDSDPIGDAEFVMALATDNPYLPRAYVQRNLGGMTKHWRERYLEGKWIFLEGTCAFDTEALTEYQKTAPEPLYRFGFESKNQGSSAKRSESSNGRIRVYREPDWVCPNCLGRVSTADTTCPKGCVHKDGNASICTPSSYAIGADVATGRGTDYSCAYVCDLHDMGLVAEFHGKIDADLFAEQLHFLGRWYNTALLAVESAGGFGEPVVISLRDGKGGRPPYPAMYRHGLDSSVDQNIMQRYGYPINRNTRPLVLSQLEKTIRERALPWMTSHLISEALTFCEFEDGATSPRAQSGCHDDAVMSCAIVLDLYRRRGHHPERIARIAKRKEKRRRPKLTLYPWQKQPEEDY